VDWITHRSQDGVDLGMREHDRQPLLPRRAHAFFWGERRRLVRDFMPAPIDWDFVPYTRRRMLRRNMHLIYDLWVPMIANIFPYIILKGDFQNTAQAASDTIPGRNADSHHL
jgi:hypothetical protein